jgi:hypothetical protein
MTGSRSTAALLRTAMGRPRGCPDLPGDHDWVVSTEQRILRTQEPTLAKTYRAVQMSKAGFLRSRPKRSERRRRGRSVSLRGTRPFIAPIGAAVQNVVFDGLASMDKKSAAEWLQGRIYNFRAERLRLNEYL